jgi:hypothetical protein
MLHNYRVGISTHLASHFSRLF